MTNDEAIKILRGIREVYKSGIAIPCAGAVSALDVVIEAMEDIDECKHMICVLCGRNTAQDKLSVCKKCRWRSET